MYEPVFRLRQELKIITTILEDQLRVFDNLVQTQQEPQQKLDIRIIKRTQLYLGDMIKHFKTLTCYAEEAETLVCELCAASSEPSPVLTMADDQQHSRFQRGRLQSSLTTHCSNIHLPAHERYQFYLGHERRGYPQYSPFICLVLGGCPASYFRRHCCFSALLDLEKNEV
jgi:hypothetical protein